MDFGDLLISSRAPPNFNLNRSLIKPNMWHLAVWERKLATDRLWIWEQEMESLPKGYCPLILVHTHFYKHTCLHCSKTFMCSSMKIFIEKEEQRILIIRSMKRNTDWWRMGQSKLWFVCCVLMVQHKEEVDVWSLLVFVLKTVLLSLSCVCFCVSDAPVKTQRFVPQTNTSLHKSQNNSHRFYICKCGYIHSVSQGFQS